MTERLRPLLDHLELTSSFVIGHSMGGSVAIVLAVMRQDLVGRLVVAEANLAAGPEEGSNATLSRSVSAQTEEAFVRSGYREMLLHVRSTSPIRVGAMQAASPRAMHLKSRSLVAERRPSLGDEFGRLPMRHAYLFGEASLKHQDMALRAAALEADGVDVLVVPKVDHWMGMVGVGARPTSFAQAISLALGPE